MLVNYESMIILFISLQFMHASALYAFMERVGKSPIEFLVSRKKMNTYMNGHMRRGKLWCIFTSSCLEDQYRFVVVDTWVCNATLSLGIIRLTHT